MVVDNNSGGGESSQCICFTRSNFPNRFNTISDPNDHDIYHEMNVNRGIRAAATPSEWAHGTRRVEWIAL